MQAKASAGWWTALAAALTGGGAFAIQEDNNDLALESIRQQTMLLRECLLQQSRGHPHDSP
jgi:hypothetical protein